MYLLCVILVCGGVLQAQATKIKITRAAVLDFEQLLGKISADPVLLLIIERADEGDALFISDEELSLALEIEEIRENLEKESDLNDEKYSDLEASLYKKENELRTIIQEGQTPSDNADAGDDDAAETDEYSANVYREIYKSIKQTALFKGFSIVLDKGSSVLFADEEADITLDVFLELLKLKEKLYKTR